MALSDEINNDLKRYAALQAEVNAGLDSYLKKVEELKKINKSIDTATENRKKLMADLSTLTGEDKKVAEAKIAVLDKQLKKLKLSRDLNKEAIKDAKLLKMTLSQAGAAITKGVWNLPKNFMGKMGMLVGLS